MPQRTQKAQRKTFFNPENICVLCVLRSHGINPDTVEPKPDFKAMIETLGLQGYLNDVKNRHDFEITMLSNITKWLSNRFVNR